MPRWAVQLAGDMSTIADLKGIFDNAKFKIEVDGVLAVLTSDWFDGLPSADEVETVAEELLRAPQAVTTLMKTWAMPLRVGRVLDLDVQKPGLFFSTDEELWAATMANRDLSDLGEDMAKGLTDRDFQAKLADLVASDPRVREAVDFWALGMKTYGSIYSLLEVIHKDLNAHKPLPAWFDTKGMERLKYNAQYYEAVGYEARHGGYSGGKHVPPTSSDVITRPEAEKLARLMLAQWLLHKCK